jgi:YgiT-type zinc finger domain-containing protein
MILDLNSTSAQVHRSLDPRRGPMRTVQCNSCGSDRYEERRIEYLYSHQGAYLLVPNTPVEVCLNCGMIYYDAAVLKEIEQRFFAIQSKTEEPDRYVEMPEKAYA